MIDPELAIRLDQIAASANAARRTAESTRKYFFWTGVVTVAVIVVPLIGLALVAPSFISNYTSTLNSLGY